MARADKNFDAMAVERESRLARRLPLPELDCAVCARPLEVLQGQHGNLSRMLARRHDQALGPSPSRRRTLWKVLRTSVSKLGLYLNDESETLFITPPLATLRVATTFPFVRELCGPRKSSELEGANRSADAVLGALDLGPDDARGAGSGDGAAGRMREFQLEGEFLSDF